MARPTFSQHGSLNLMEELERLEQSITLTLQEIDHNFSRAHRIVTGGVLPVVEQYAEQSRGVWDGCKFWKQFFEASANVSLSGYEDVVGKEAEGSDKEEADQDATPKKPHGESAGVGDISVDNAASFDHEGDSVMRSVEEDPEASSLVVSPSRTSTPKTSGQQQELHTPNQEITSSSFGEFHERGAEEDISDDTPSRPPTTSRTPSTKKQAPITPFKLEDTANADTNSTPLSSLSYVPPPQLTSTSRETTKKEQDEDPILHRVLDKTYRIQATPLAARSARATPATRSKFAEPQSTAAAKSKFSQAAFMASSSPSSPELEVPKLNSQLFDTPVREKVLTRGRKGHPLGPTPGGASVGDKRNRSRSQSHSPIKPRLSILPGQKHDQDKDKEDDDDHEETGAHGEDSPPKTMQFHIPQSRLLQTPAKEASRRIVSDLLFSAGVGNDSTQDSPTTPTFPASRRRLFGDESEADDDSKRENEANKERQGNEDISM